MSDEPTSDQLVEAEIANHRNRYRAVLPGPIPQRTEGVFAPAVSGAQGSESAAVSPKAGRQPLKHKPTGHRPREGMRDEIRCAGAELATLVIAPAVGRAQVGERASMADGEPARRNQLEGEAPRYGDWHSAGGRGPITELAPIVASPAVSVPRAGNRTGVSSSSVDTDELESARDLHRRIPTGGRVVAQLAVRIIPPAIRRSVARQAAGVRTAPGTLDQSESAHHRDRDYAA